MIKESELQTEKQWVYQDKELFSFYKMFGKKKTEKVEPYKILESLRVIECPTCEDGVEGVTKGFQNIIFLARKENNTDNWVLIFQYSFFIPERLMNEDEIEPRRKEGMEICLKAFAKLGTDFIEQFRASL